MMSSMLHRRLMLISPLALLGAAALGATLTPQQVSLEDAFMQLTRSSVEYHTGAGAAVEQRAAA